jgi:hypothetical protein
MFFKLGIEDAMFRRVVVALAVLFSGPAVSGTPIEVPFVCPVGGEEFTVLETASCSSMGATMSLRSASSCEFVTRLPVCPSNGFPAYRDFGDEELGKLADLVGSDEYAALLDLSPFQRAYGVAALMGETNSEQAFWLQMSSVWYEADVFFADASLVNKFLIEAEGQRSRVSDEDRPYFLSSVAYVLGKSGKVDEARHWLAEASASSDGSEFLEAYIRNVEKCLGAMDTSACQPNAEWEY